MLALVFIEIVFVYFLVPLGTAPNPSATEAEIELFYRATEAYKRGDLKALRLIDAIVESNEAKDDEESSGAAMEKETERLEGLIEAVQKDIEGIKSGLYLAHLFGR